MTAQSARSRPAGHALVEALIDAVDYAYTDGTRLFAYRAVRTKLNCRELTAALAEIRTASKSLSGEMPGVSADQVSRTRALNGQVESELAKERGVRCKG